jgi:hypothetical protein
LSAYEKEKHRVTGVEAQDYTEPQSCCIKKTYQRKLFIQPILSKRYGKTPTKFELATWSFQKNTACNEINNHSFAHNLSAGLCRWVYAAKGYIEFGICRP